MAYKLALNEDGAAKVQEDGRVVYIDDTDGKEVPIDVNQMYLKINNLNSESAQRRRRVNELEIKLGPLEGIEDIATFVREGQAALDKIADGANTGDADVEALKAQLKESYEARFTALAAEAATEQQKSTDALKAKDDSIYKLLVSSEFSKSEFFAGDNAQTFLTAEMAEKIWGERFKVEESNGQLRIVGYDLLKNQILSRENPGEPAGFQEAIGSIVDSDPNKARYMRAGNSGSGGQGNQNSSTTDTSDVGVLVSQYKKAQAAGDTTGCLAIKKRLNEIGHANAVL